MLKIEYHSQFKKDLRLAAKRGCDLEKLKKVIELLANEIELPKNNKDHALTNSKNYKNTRECHIGPDWLLIYRKESDRLVLELLRTGSHSDLF